MYYTQAQALLQLFSLFFPKGLIFNGFLSKKDFEKLQWLASNG